MVHTFRNCNSLSASGSMLCSLLQQQYIHPCEGRWWNTGTPHPVWASSSCRGSGHLRSQHTSVPRQGHGGATAPASLPKEMMPLLWQGCSHWHAGTRLFCRLLAGNHVKWFWTFHVMIQNVRCGRQMPHLLHMFNLQQLCKQHWSSWLSYKSYTGFRFGALWSAQSAELTH